MKLAKKLALVACAGLLLAGGTNSARHAFAQDAEEIDPNAGYWDAGGVDANSPDAGSPAANSADADSADANSADDSSPEAKLPPIDIGGCWSGIAGDKASGTGDAFFDFNQDGKKLLGKNTSLLEFSWVGPPEANAEGPLSGSVTSKGFKFKGNAGKHCSFKGSGEGNSSELIGKIKFSGKCASQFKEVTFSVNPVTCVCL